MMMLHFCETNEPISVWYVDSVPFDGVDCTSVLINFGATLAASFKPR